MEVKAREWLERKNPLRRVDWRWRTACLIVSKGRRVSRKRDSAPILEAVQFLRTLERNPGDPGLQSVTRKWPTLGEAYDVAQGNPRRRWEIQARLLAGETDQAIALTSGLSVEAVALYESLFFGVRDYFEARNWILVQAIGTEILTGVAPDDLGTIWRAVGYYGGPDALEIAMAVTLGKKLPDWVEERERVERPGYTERLRLSCEIAVDVWRIPRDTPPKVLLALHQELLRKRSSRDRPNEPELTWQSVDRLLEGEKFLAPDSADNPSAATAVA